MQELSYRDQVTDVAFGRAIDLLDAGDASGLADHLAVHPDLTSQQVRFDGNYFTQPTLLHFAAENPIRNAALPASICQVMQVILDAGAAVDASSHPDRAETTLALVASGMIPRITGHQQAMLERLIACGADPQLGLNAALAHAERDAALTLLQHGAMYGLVAAASLGDVPGVHRYFAASDPDERQRGLALASHNGQATAVTALLALGVDANTFNPEGAHAHATPLHTAVAAGHIEVVQALLDQRVETQIKDRLFGGTARQWADHCDQPAIGKLLDEHAA